MPTVVNTDWTNPTANMAENSGDGDGFEILPVQGHADDEYLAVDNNSGSNKANSCTNNRKDKHQFFDYDLPLPAGVTITGIEVQLDALVDSSANSPRMCVQLSWDGGTTWTNHQSTATLSTSESSYLLGGSNNLWERTWTTDELSDANFRVRIINVARSTSRDFMLDWVGVKVYYESTEPVASLSPNATSQVLRMDWIDPKAYLADATSYKGDGFEVKVRFQ
jgi:hypothetical protein